MCDNSECAWLSNSGTVIYSMDAFFGLPHKKIAGKSFRDPLHGSLSLFFGDQCAVDVHVAAREAYGKAIPKVMLSDDVLMCLMNTSVLF